MGAGEAPTSSAGVRDPRGPQTPQTPQTPLTRQTLQTPQSPRDPQAPQKPRTSNNLRPLAAPGTGSGVALSMLAHLGLFAALAYGVNWRAPAPVAVSAELWSALPRSAAPALESPAAPAPTATPTPPPAPSPQVAPAPLPDAQIALEQARKRRATEELASKALALEKSERAEKAAQVLAQRTQAQLVNKAAKEAQELKDAQAARDTKARAEKEQKAQEAKDAKTAAAEAAALAKAREENVKRMMGQLANAGASGTAGVSGATGAPGSRGDAAQDSAPTAAYGGRLVRAIKPHIVFSGNSSGNPAAEVEVRTAPNGSILGRSLLRSSGNKAWDDAVLRAIDATATLPRDTDGRVPPVLAITFRPLD